MRLTGSTSKVRPPSREKALWMVVLPCASASVLPRPSVAILPGMASKYSRWPSSPSAESAGTSSGLVTCISAPPACGPSRTPGSGSQTSPSAEKAERMRPLACVQ